MKKHRPNGFDRLYRNPPKTTLGLFGIFEPERPSAFEQKLKELCIRQDQAARNGTMLAWDPCQPYACLHPGRRPQRRRLEPHRLGWHS